jgi:hypothetical protein
MKEPTHAKVLLCCNHSIQAPLKEFAMMYQSGLKRMSFNASTRQIDIVPAAFIFEFLDVKINSSSNLGMRVWIGFLISLLQ